MKRLLVLLLAAVLLAGCVYEPPETTGAQTEATDADPTEQTRAPGEGLRYAGADLNGAVISYRLESGCDRLILTADGMLMCSSDGLRSYVEEFLYPENTASIENALVLQLSDSGVACYEESTRTLTILDESLNETSHYVLSEEILGLPAVSTDLKTVYYCTAEGIRSLDRTTGIARLMRQQSGLQGIAGTCFDSEMLMCRKVDENGMESLVFITAGTGVQTDQTACLEYVDTYGGSYFLLCYGEDGAEYLFGQRSGGMLRFDPEADALQVESALALGSVVTVSETPDGLQMDLYELESGLRTASTVLSGLENIRAVTADPNGYVWFLAYHTAQQRDMLYRWEVGLSPVRDDTVYTSQRFTAENPDLEGLEACRQTAETMADTYGVQIRIWEDATAAPWEDLKAEYRVDVLKSALAALDQALSRYPEDFLAKLGDICDSGAVSISIVADAGEEQARQDWYKGDACIVLEISDGLEDGLNRVLYRVIDTYVMNKNGMLDEWDADNPVQDRVELFANAMDPDAAEDIDSDKLETLCKAIRDAFGLKKYEGTLPWEQHLGE